MKIWIDARICDEGWYYANYICELVDAFVKENQQHHVTVYRKNNLSNNRRSYLDERKTKKIFEGDTGAKIISNFEIVNHFGEKDIDWIPMNHGWETALEFGVVKYVVATHSSSFSDGSYAWNPGWFVIYCDETSFYISGDTGLTMDMKLIPLMCPKLDFAILPIGDQMTMWKKEAAKAAEFVETKHVIGCHFDTFDFLKIDKNDTIKYFKDQGISLWVPTIWEQVKLNNDD